MSAAEAMGGTAAILFLTGAVFYMAAWMEAGITGRRVRPLAIAAATVMCAAGLVAGIAALWMEVPA